MDSKTRRLTFCGLAAAVIAGGWLVPHPRISRADAEARQSKSEYGVTLALAGNQSRAESVFVSLLSDTRGDARALNNLGNLRLLRGELGVALAFYDRALKGDSTDAGIHLNRATALMLMNDDERAQQSAAVGIRLAGGEDKANALLGLKGDAAAGPKKAGVALVNKDEVKALLRRAAAAVPSDTLRDAVPRANATRKKKAPTWRSAGPRGADASDAASVLYWKR